MSQSLHVCKVCGKWFATAKAVHGHQRVHSELKRDWGLKKPPRVCSVSTSLDPLQRGSKATSSSYLKDSSFMTEIEKQEMHDAAMSLVMLSQGVSSVRNLPPGGIAIHCVDQSKEELSEVSATCSDVVAQEALPSPLRGKPLTKRESNFSYRIKICGKSFERSLCGHQRDRGKLACEKEEFEVGNSLCDVLTDSGAEKVVPEPSCFGVSQGELIERRDTNVKEHSVEPRQDFSKVVSHSGFEKSSSYSDVAAQESLLIPLGSKLQEKTQRNSSYKCKVCGKSFGRFQALGGHQKLHRPISVILGRKRKRFEDGNSPPSGSSEAKKIVPQPLSLEVSHGEVTELRDTNVKEHWGVD